MFSKLLYSYLFIFNTTTSPLMLQCTFYYPSNWKCIRLRKNYGNHKFVGQESVSTAEWDFEKCSAYWKICGFELFKGLKFLKDKIIFLIPSTEIYKDTTVHMQKPSFWMDGRVCMLNKENILINELELSGTSKYVSWSVRLHTL